MMTIKFEERYVEPDEVYLLTKRGEFEPRDIINIATCYLGYAGNRTIIRQDKINYRTDAANRFFINPYEIDFICKAQKGLISKSLLFGIDFEYYTEDDAIIEPIRRAIFEHIEDDPCFAYLAYFTRYINDEIDDIEKEINIESNFRKSLEATVPILKVFIDWKVHEWAIRFNKK